MLARTLLWTLIPLYFNCHNATSGNVKYISISLKVFKSLLEPSSILCTVAILKLNAFAKSFCEISKDSLNFIKLFFVKSLIYSSSNTKLEGPLLPIVPSKTIAIINNSFPFEMYYAKLSIDKPYYVAI